MKNSLILACLILLPLTAVAQPAPILHLPFNEGDGPFVYDLAGLRTPLRVEGGTGWIPGRVDDALAVDGSQRIKVPEALVSAAEIGSFSVWLRVQDAPEATAFALTQPVSNGNHSWTLALQPGSGNFSFQCQRNATTGGGAFSISTPSSIHAVGAWAHVTVTFSPSATHIYVNGTPAASGDGCGSLQTIQPFFLIGASQQHPSSQSFRGWIDDVRVYDVALSATQALDLYNALLTEAMTIDSTPPTQSNPALLRLSATEIEMSVALDEASRVHVELGVGVELGGTLAWDPQVALSHLRSASSLVPDLPYEFRLWALDDAGNVSKSDLTLAGTASAELELHLPFDESAGSAVADASGNFSGLAFDAAPTWLAGPVAGAVELADERIDITAPFLAAQGYGTYAWGTYAAWVRPGQILGHDQHLISEPTTNGTGFALKLQGNSGRLELYFESSDGVSTVAHQVLGPHLPVGVWSHVAASVSPSASLLFVDGELVAQGSTGTTWRPPANRTVIGDRQPGSTLQRLRGRLDDLRIYDLPLAGAEIAQLYALGLPGALTYRFPFNEGVGPFVYDTARWRPPLRLEGLAAGAGSWTAGPIEEALEFDGEQLLRIPESLVDDGQGTYSAWIRTDSAPPGNPRFVLAQSLINGNNSWSLALFPGSGQIGFLCQQNATTGGGAHWVLAPSTITPLGTWRHVVVAFDGSGTEIYVDGAAVASGDGCGALQPTIEEFTVGGKSYQFAQTAFAGELDDLRVYDRKLEALEVQGLYLESLDLASTTDSNAPIQSDLEILRRDATSARLAADTDEDTRLHVEFGLGPELGATAPWSPAVSSAHRREIGDLSADLPHHFQAWTIDDAGNVGGGEVVLSGNGSRQLLLHLPLDEGQGSTAHDAANGDAPWPILAGTPWANGVSGTALDFEAAGQVIDVGRGFLSQTGQGAYSVWIRPDEVPTADRYILAESVGGANPSWTVKLTSGGHFTVRFQSSDGATCDYPTIQGPAVPALEWSHLAVSFSTGVTQLFVNGELVASGATGSACQTPNQKLVVGSHPWGGASHLGFRGRIDDVKIFDLPLGQADAHDLYAAGLPSALRYHLRFNEGDGPFAYDTAEWREPRWIEGGGTWTPGQIEQALEMTGEQLIRLEEPLVSTWSEATYSVWLQTDQSPVSHQWILGESLIAGNSSWNLVLQPGSGNLSLYCQKNATTGGGAHWVQAPGYSPVGAWTHVVVAFDALATRFYVDGALVTTADGCGALQASLGEFLVGGRSYQFPTGAYQGQIDDLRVYGRALSPAEIATLVAESALLPQIEDNAPPIQSDPSAVRLGPTEARVTVTTSEPARLAVEAGIGPELGSALPITDLEAASHQATASDLAPDLPYFFRLWTVDEAGNASSADVAIGGAGVAAPILHLTLDEGTGTTVHDAANGDQPWPITGTNVQWTAGIAGGSALAYSSEQQIIVDRSLIGGTGIGAYSVWIHPSAGASGERYILAESVGGHNPSWALRLGPSGKLTVYFQSRDGVTNSSYTIVGPVVPTETWSHVVVSFEPSTTSIFLDGELVASGPTGTTFQALNHRFAIGAHPYGGAAHVGFVGGLDDVRVYDLPLNEVQALQVRGESLNDTDPPVILSEGIVEVGAYPGTGGEIVVEVTLDELARVQLEYGQTPTWSASGDWTEGFASSHTLRLTGLDFDASYQVRVRAEDAVGNPVTVGQTLLADIPSRPSEIYVAAGGTASGRGSLADPLDFETVLGRTDLDFQQWQPGLALPGDTVYLERGTYQTHGGPMLNFAILTPGTEAAPITVRPRLLTPPYPVLDGPLVILTDYITVHNLELTSSVPRPPITNTRLENYQLIPDLVPSTLTIGRGLRFFNNIVHGLFSSNRFVQSGMEIYGNLFYDNGMLSSDKIEGHQIYPRNDDGFFFVEDNLAWNSYNLHISGFCSSYNRVDMHATGNILFRGGVPVREQDPGNGHVGGGILHRCPVTPVEDSLIQDNVLGGTSLNVVGAVDSIQADNLIVDGAIFPIGVEQLTLTDNRLIRWQGNAGVEIRSSDPNGQPSGYFLDRNQYTNSNFVTNWTDAGGVFQQINFGTGLQAFSDWQTFWGQEANSDYFVTPPTGLEVIVRPNRLEAGRANVAVLNWSGAASASVDLSGVLDPGDRFSVYNVLDLRRVPGAFVSVTPEATGIYDGTTVQLPLRADPEHPYLDVFLVLLTD